MGHLVYIFWALRTLWGLKEISRLNRLRLWRKSFNLYLAFLAFTDKKRPTLQLKRAMISAYLSAVYDYDTDWIRTKNPETSMFFRELRRLLKDHPNEEAAIKAAEDLFQIDWENKLSVHGLERGSVALRFYWLVIRSEWMEDYTENEIDSFGRKLQIVDDILDWEKDTEKGHTNCFNTEEKISYVVEGERFLDSPFFCKLVKNSWIYWLLRRTCKRKLRRME